MLAKQNPILEDAVETIYELTADESIREQCKAREKHIREMNTILGEREIAIQKLDETTQKLDETTHKLDVATQERDEAIQRIEQQARQIEQLLLENRRLKEQ